MFQEPSHMTPIQNKRRHTTRQNPRQSTQAMDRQPKRQTDSQKDGQTYKNKEKGQKGRSWQKHKGIYKSIMDSLSFFGFHWILNEILIAWLESAGRSQQASQKGPNFMDLWIP